MIDTKEKILDTAERLFGDQGYAATSLRHIISDAGVNLAAVHYHFGSKEDLLDHVITRKAGPLNESRMALLDRFEKEAGGASPPIEKILEAFLAPLAEMASCNPQMLKVMGRMHFEGLMPLVIKRHFQPVVMRFIAAFRRALPELPEDELYWRLHFMTGAMAHSLCGSPFLTEAGLEREEMQRRLQRLVTFLTAGFHAPAAPSDPYEVGK
jgi:AcrR family transcriptional regulator